MRLAHVALHPFSHFYLVPSAHNTILDVMRQKARLPCYLYKPYVENTDFVGRNTVVDDLCVKLLPVAAHLVRSDSTRVFAMVGLGGMGKTQTALHFMFKHLSKFQAVFWASADSSTKLTESFVNFAVELGLAADNTTDQQAAIDSVKSWLNFVGTWKTLISGSLADCMKMSLGSWYSTMPMARMPRPYLMTSGQRVLMAAFS
jgi:hypothetical protein